MKKESTIRADRICDQIKRDLSELIPREIADPAVGMVTITGVEITPDYAHATVHFTSMGSTPEASANALNKNAQRLYDRIFKLLHIHTVPRLHFVYDESVEKGFAMDQLIKEARADDAKKIKE